MITDLTKLLIGVPFLKKLPESAYRAYNIISNSNLPIQNVEETAQFIWNQIPKVKRIIIITGFYCKSGYETDGPVGALILAEFFLKTKIPVQICCEKEFSKIMKSIANELNFPKQLQFTHFDSLGNLEDSLLITIERPGENIKGICHSMNGKKISVKIYPFEKKIQKEPPAAWVGIGDGGNELGTGYYRKTIEQRISFGKHCICGCNGGIAAFKEANKCLMAVTSNFGAIGLSFELAKQGNIDWGYSLLKDNQLIKKFNTYGIKDGITGEDGTVDAIPSELYKKMLVNLFDFFI